VDELLGSDPSASRFMELQDGMTSGCLGALVWKCGSLDSHSCGGLLIEIFLEQNKAVAFA